MTHLDLQQRIAQLEKEVEVLEVLKAQKDGRIADLEDELRIKQNHIKLRDTYISELEADGHEAQPQRFVVKLPEPAYNEDDHPWLEFDEIVEAIKAAGGEIAE